MTIKMSDIVSSVLCSELCYHGYNTAYIIVTVSLKLYSTVL